MSAVLRLVETTHHETVALLSALLEEAKRGEIIGIAGCIRWHGGRERIMRTGPYRSRDCAVAMSARMTARLLEDQTKY